MVICCKINNIYNKCEISYTIQKETRKFNQLIIKMQMWSILCVIIILTIRSGNTIDCFQCNSSSNMECSDVLMNLNGGILQAFSCNHVYNAQYCIKETGRITTKRYCSSLDLGTYCNYVQQPGDKMEYRTCIYTCRTDGCNGTSHTKISMIYLILGVIMLHVSF